PIGAVARATDDVVELERIEDAINRRARQPQPIDEITDARAAASLLQEKEHVHHPVDHWDAVLGDRGVGGDVVHEWDRAPIDFIRAIPLTSKVEHGKFTFE